MTTNYSDPESLATLAATVNQALIETGRFFRSSGSIQSRAQLKRSIPAAHEQFQFALDDLSEQIFLAKAFLERDYEAIRATKTESQTAQDVAMGETMVKPEPETGEQAQEKVEEVDIKTEQTTEDVTTNPPVPAATELSQPNESDQPVKIEKPCDTPAVPDQSTTETKFDTGQNETAGGGKNDFDLHLDFGDDEIGNQNFLSMNTGGGANETDEFGNSITAGGDAFDLEFEKAGTRGEQQQKQQQQQQQQQQPQPQTGADSQTGEQSEDIIAPGESSFDDLFMGSGDMGDQGLLEGDELMNIEELDDNWFT
ncbi:uncharacterized protein EURHEDRAFT_500139 [Aspergillus ruber CBS 135680]|uniref:Uncharacterized protein n=1 Tax=Aspergillus ruber (strain CBS 135680) TaxID=1388766 RepID=A0A017SFB9_ASPRC|nr:uncharacterized protein EURHEDRAFT_500139 [Aspergillus ruber CBS 135680]EYE95451.1 hypothetical protein EURHEDRAFT_500139 [Aspergillus ruber CBS 135680]